MSLEKLNGDLPSIVHRGVEYRVKGPTLSIRDKFERWFRRKAFSDLAELKPIMTKAEYEAEFTKTRRDASAGYYRFGGSLFQEVIQSEAGFQQLLYLLLNHYDKGLELSTVVEMMSDEDTMRSIQASLESLSDAEQNPTIVN
jgi:hypothetical protein